MLLNSSIGLAAMPHTLKVGDTFTFSITDLAFKNQVNGTEYDTTNPPFKAGDTVDVTIDNIGSATVDAGLTQSETTYFNITEKVGGNEYKSSTVLDEWMSIYLVFTLLLAFSTFSLITYPETGYFGPPSNETSGETGSTFNGTGLPYFATSNESYYEKAEGMFNDTQVNLGDQSFDEFTTASSAKYDKDAKEFTAKLDVGIKDQNQTSSGEAASLEIALNFYLTVDVARSLVTYMYANYLFSMSIGSASTLTQMTFGFKEGTQGGGGVGGSSVPAPSIFLVFSALVAIGVIQRRRK